MAETYTTGGGWGDRIDVDAVFGPHIRVHGWKPRTPKLGDLLEVPMQSGKTGVYSFVQVAPCEDPPDMFFGTCKMQGYK